MLRGVIVFLCFIQVLLASSPGNECSRDCDNSTAAMECYFEFTVEEYFTMTEHCKNCIIPDDFLGYVEDCLVQGCVPGGGQDRLVAAVNRQVPGPKIEVCLGDKVIVNVSNHFNSDGAVIHWHGVHQKGTPHMDGTPYLTQCPIPPHTYFVYMFTADVPGTHMWHAHIGTEEADGVFGPMVIRRPASEEPHNSLYDHDLSEHTIIVWHWFARTARDMLTMSKFKPGQSFTGEGFIINGLGGIESFDKSYIEDTFNSTIKAVFNVTKGERYRFRVIFNTALPCPLQMSVEGHKLLAISSESSSFNPESVDAIMLNGGERYDFVLNADAAPGNYWIRFRGLGSCKSGSVAVHQEAVLHYDGAEYYSLPNSIPTYEDATVTGKILNPIGEIANNLGDDLVYMSDLENAEAVADDVSGTPAKIIYIEFSSKRYEESGIPAFFPQLNKRTFSYPSFPLLTQRNEIQRHMYCTDDDVLEEGKFQACPYLYQVDLNSLVEVVFIDPAKRGGDHPFHLHGYQFHVVALEMVGEDIDPEQVKNLNKAGNITKNYKGPVKDTVSVPSAGYAVLRFFANNPGFWFFHCHISNHAELGMGFVLQVGTLEQMSPVPQNFMQCRNWEETANENIDTGTDTGGNAERISSLALVVMGMVWLNWWL